MQHSRRTAVKRIAAAAAAIGLAGCNTGADDTDETDTTTEPESEATTATAATTTATDATATSPATEAEPDYTVGMYTDLYFDPVGLHVEPGETVAFELVSGAHSATAYHPDNENALRRRIPEGAPAWNTGTFGDVGTARTVTFETAGTHDYYCIPHKMVGMVGRIVVGEPGGPAEDAPNPDLELPDSDRIVADGSVAWDDWKSNV
jgi:plastocyanin